MPANDCRRAQNRRKNFPLFKLSCASKTIDPSFLQFCAKNLASRAESPPTGGGEEAQRRVRAGVPGGFSADGGLALSGGAAARHRGTADLRIGLARRSCVTGGYSGESCAPGLRDEVVAALHGGRTAGGALPPTERTTDIYYYMERKVFCASALSAQKRHATFDLFRAGRSALCALVEWCAPHSKRGRSAKRGTPCVPRTHGVLFSAARQAVKKFHAAVGTNCTARRSVERILRGSL